MAASQRVATIKRFTGHQYSVPYDLDEPAYVFATRVAQILPDGFVSDRTPRYLLRMAITSIDPAASTGNPFSIFCTFENRMRNMRDIIRESMVGIGRGDWPTEIPNDFELVLVATDWTFQCGAKSIFMCNSLDPHCIATDRSTCTLCGNPIVDICSGPTTNPLIPIVLECGHAYHRGCLAQYEARRDFFGAHICEQCDGESLDCDSSSSDSPSNDDVD